MKKATDRSQAAPSLFRERTEPLVIGKRFDDANDATLYPGDCMELLQAMPDEVADLVITSPPC